MRVCNKGKRKDRHIQKNIDRERVLKRDADRDTDKESQRQRPRKTETETERDRVRVRQRHRESQRGKCDKGRDLCHLERQSK